MELLWLPDLTDSQGPPLRRTPGTLRPHSQRYPGYSQGPPLRSTNRRIYHYGTPLLQAAQFGNSAVRVCLEICHKDSFSSTETPDICAWHN